MFQQVFDNFRKATETTMQAQQDLFGQWMSQWSKFPLTPGAPAAPAVPEQIRSYQKQWAENVTALLTRHCEALDAQYRAGIKTIEDALRTTEARSPEEFRKLTEELWRNTFEVLKKTVENQIRDFQVVIETWTEMITKKPSKT